MKRFVSMPPAANPWAKPEHMRSREWLRAGFRASKAITAMSWDYRWHWFTECCESQERFDRLGGSAGSNFSSSSLNLNLFFFFFLLCFFLFGFRIFHGGLEVTNAFPQTLAHGRELAGAEHQKRDRNNQQQMQRLKKTFTHNPSTGILRKV